MEIVHTCLMLDTGLKFYVLMSDFEVKVMNLEKFMGLEAKCHSSELHRPVTAFITMSVHQYVCLSVHLFIMFWSLGSGYLISTAYCHFLFLIPMVMALQNQCQALFKRRMK